MVWANVEDVDNDGVNLIGATLQSILHIGGRAAAQEWGMKLLHHKSVEDIRAASEKWPPEVLELMAEKLIEDERFN
jgi:hypothetical protein